MIRRIFGAVLIALAFSSASLEAQQGAARAPLEAFVSQVAQIWSNGDVGRLVDLLPDGGRIVLDTGSGMETVNARHASAALRALFFERETTSVRSVRVTFAGGEPARGFGELSWGFRGRGVPAPQSRTVYVGTVWEGNGWRIAELRLMP